MNERPYVLLSCAMSIDGYIDDASEKRLMLSGAADFDRVDDVRSTCDAILVGAETIRRDNPRLLVRSEARRDARIARGESSSPIKVTLTRRADLDPSRQFFAAGECEKIVYCASAATAAARGRLGVVATVVDAGDPPALSHVLADLAQRGVRRLMVEGGGSVHTQFITSCLADELNLVVAPIFVGDSRAARFVGDGAFPWNAEHRATLAEVRQIEDVVLLRYALSPRFNAA